MDEFKFHFSSDVCELLINANFKTLISIIQCKELKLAKLTRCNIQDVRKIRSVAAKSILKNKINTANRMPHWSHISFGCIAIDDITRGGISVNGITEIVGYSGTGKTQLCLQLALRVQLPEAVGGLNKGALYICTEDAFPSKRLNQLANIYQNKYNNINFENNIIIEHIADYLQLSKFLNNRLPILLQFKNIGLIVLDSIAGIFRSENVNVNYVTRSQEFMSICTKFLEFSSNYHLAVVCVNQVADDVNTGETIPCLGLAWGSLLTYRFNISRYIENARRNFEIIFGPDLPNRSTSFQISSEGIV